MVKEKNDIFAEEDPIIKEYFETLNKLNKDEEFRMHITEEEDAELIYRSDMHLARDEGKKLANTETAKNLLAMGILSVEQIAEATKLSLEEIEELQ